MKGGGGGRRRRRGRMRRRRQRLRRGGTSSSLSHPPEEEEEEENSSIKKTVAAGRKEKVFSPLRRAIEREAARQIPPSLAPKTDPTKRRDLRGKFLRQRLRRRKTTTSTALYGEGGYIVPPYMLVSFPPAAKRGKN